MTSTADKKGCKIGCSGLKPLTGQNILYYYAPLQGAISYAALSVNVMNPSLILRLFPRRDITNILLVNTIAGAGLYLFNRPHLKSLPPQQRILYSSFGAVSFSLSSVLVWAILRSIVPENVAVCTACGLISAAAIMNVATSYTNHVDSSVRTVVV